MRRWLLALAPAFSLFGQSVEGPQFEVASLKKLKGFPSYIQNLTGGPGTSTPTRVTMRSGLRQLFPAAFDRTWSELANIETVPSDWYEFAATIREGATKDEYRAMLRNLLRPHLSFVGRKHSAPYHQEPPLIPATDESERRKASKKVQADRLGFCLMGLILGSCMVGAGVWATATEGARRSFGFY